MLLGYHGRTFARDDQEAEVLITSYSFRRIKNGGKKPSKSSDLRATHRRFKAKVTNIL